MSEHLTPEQEDRLAKIKFAIALSAVQGELATIKHNRTVDVGKFKYRYTTYDAMLDAIRPLLATHRFSLVNQSGYDAEKRLMMKVTLIHDSGHSESTYLPIKATGDPRALGSELSYMRRYGAACLLGLAFEDEDDDGAAAKEGASAAKEGASAAKSRGGQQKPAPKRQPAEDDEATARSRLLWKRVGDAAKSIGKSKQEGEGMLRELMQSMFGKERSTKTLTPDEHYQIGMELWKVRKENTHPDDLDEKEEPKKPKGE